MNPQADNSSSDNNSTRCHHRTATGRRCRLLVLENSSLCFRHAALRDTPSIDPDLSATFAQLSEFRSAVPINDFLSKLLSLLVQNRVSTRRAAVLAYITNQLLRTLPAIDRELNPKEDPDQPINIIWDVPRPDRRPSNACPEATPQREPTYADLRT